MKADHLSLHPTLKSGRTPALESTGVGYYRRYYSNLLASSLMQPSPTNYITDASSRPLNVFETCTQPEVVSQVGIDIPLGIYVPQAMKEKIWEGAYIDLSSLYTDTASTVLARADSNYVTVVIEGDQLVLRKASAASKKVDTFEKWQSAFHTYMAIYLTKHPTRAAELLKYMDIIRLATTLYPGLGWKRYDEQFRIKQTSDPTRSWGNLDMELWLTVVALPVQVSHSRVLNPTKSTLV